jgi:hypothetical protein
LEIQTKKNKKIPGNTFFLQKQYKKFFLFGLSTQNLKNLGNPKKKPGNPKNYHGIQNENRGNRNKNFYSFFA